MPVIPLPFPWVPAVAQGTQSTGNPIFSCPTPRPLPKWAPPYPAPKWQSPSGARGPLAPCHASVQAVESVADIFSVSDSCVICVSGCTATRVCVLAACVGVRTRGERTEHHTGQASTCSFPPGRGHTRPADRQEASQGAGLVFEPPWFEGRVGCLGQSEPGEEGGSVHVLCLAACPRDGSAPRGRPHPTGLSQHPALLQGLRKEKTQPRAHPGLRAARLPPEGSNMEKPPTKPLL